MVFAMGLLKNNLNDRQFLNAAEKRLQDVRKGKWPDDTHEWIRTNLKHSNWQVRNIAIKLVGVGRIPGFFDVLSEFLTDKSQVGFIRRNSAVSLYAFHSVEDTVLNAFVCGLDDPYWEVRTESANGLARHGKPDEPLTHLLIAKIYRKPLDRIPAYPIFRPTRIFREKNFEVRAALFGALGTVMADKSFIHALEIPLEEDIWKVRETALKAFVVASRRLGFSDEQIQENLSRLDLTSTEFIPTFPIRQTLSALSDTRFNDIDNESNGQVVNRVI